MRLLGRLRRARPAPTVPPAPTAPPGERLAGQVARPPAPVRRDWAGLPPPPLVSTTPVTASDPVGRGAGRAVRWSSPPPRLAHARSGADGGLVTGLATVLPTGRLGVLDAAPGRVTGPEPDLPLAVPPPPADDADGEHAAPATEPAPVRRLPTVAAPELPHSVRVPALPEPEPVGARVAPPAARDPGPGPGTAAAVAGQAPDEPGPARLPDVPVGLGPGVRLVRRPLREPQPPAPEIPRGSGDELPVLPLVGPARHAPSTEIVERRRVIDRAVLEPRRLAAAPAGHGPAAVAPGRPAWSGADVPLPGSPAGVGPDAGPAAAPAGVPARPPAVTLLPLAMTPLGRTLTQATPGAPVVRTTPAARPLPLADVRRPAAAPPGERPGPVPRRPVPHDERASAPVVAARPQGAFDAAPPAPTELDAGGRAQQAPVRAAAPPDAPLLGSEPLRPLPEPVVLTVGVPVPLAEDLPPGPPLPVVAGAAAVASHPAPGGRAPDRGRDLGAPRRLSTTAAAAPGPRVAAQARTDVSPLPTSTLAAPRPQPLLPDLGRPSPASVRDLPPDLPPVPSRAPELVDRLGAPARRPEEPTAPDPPDHRRHDTVPDAARLPVRAAARVDGAGPRPRTSGPAPVPLVLAVTPHATEQPDSADAAPAQRPPLPGAGPALLVQGLARAAAEVDAALTADPAPAPGPAPVPTGPNAAPAPPPALRAAPAPAPDAAAIADEVYEHVRARLRDELLAGRERTTRLAGL